MELYQKLVRKIELGFDSASVDKIHKFLARSFSMATTVQFYLYATRYMYWADKLSFGKLSTLLPRNFLIFGFGMWLASTEWSKRHRILFSILFLPSVVMSTPWGGRMGNIYYVMVLLFGVWTYWRIWRRGGKMSKINRR